MNVLLPCLLALSLLLVGCGGKDAGTAASGAAEPAPGPGVDVSNLPDPCSLLTGPMASELLQVEQVQQKNLQNEQMVARMCNYSDASGEGNKMMLMSLGMYGSHIMSSATDSRETLVAKASKLAGDLPPSEILDDLGNISFVFNQGAATRLQVLTGLGGKAEGSDQLASELQIGYAINNPDMEPAQRQQLLLALARQHLSALEAGTTP